MPVFLFKARITKNEPLVGHRINEGLKIGRRTIIDIGGIAGPTHDQAQMIEQQTQFAADDPTSIRLAFASNLTFTASLAAWMNQLNSIGVYQSTQRTCCHEPL